MVTFSDLHKLLFVLVEEEGWEGRALGAIVTVELCFRCSLLMIGFGLLNTHEELLNWQL